MRIERSCAHLQKASKPDRGFIKDAYDPAASLAEKVKDALVSFTNDHHNPERTESDNPIHNVVEKGLEAVFGISSDKDPESFNAGFEAILTTFKELDDALHDSNNYVYCSGAFATAKHDGKTYQEDTKKTPPSVDGHVKMWNLVTSQWTWVDDPICPPEGLGRSYLGSRDVVVLCGDNLNNKHDPGSIRNRLEPINRHFRASLNGLSLTWMGILLHGTLHTLSEELIDVKMKSDDKEIEAYRYQDTKALAASGDPVVFYNVNNYLFFGFGIWFALRGWTINWINGVMGQVPSQNECDEN